MHFVHRYSRIWWWADSSIAYYNVPKAEDVKFPASAAHPADDISYKECVECISAFSAHNLCEVDKARS